MRMDQLPPPRTPHHVPEVEVEYQRGEFVDLRGHCGFFLDQLFFASFQLFILLHQQREHSADLAIAGLPLIAVGIDGCLEMIVKLG